MLSQVSDTREELEKLRRKGWWTKEESKRFDELWSEEELVQEISRQLNPDHYDERVFKYADQCVSIRDASGHFIEYRQKGKQAHPFPGELPSVAENRLEHLVHGDIVIYPSSFRSTSEDISALGGLTQGERNAMARALRDELLTIFLPYKKQALYRFDPSREKGPHSYGYLHDWQRKGLEVHAGSEQWEITLFPEVVNWLRDKAKKLWEPSRSLQKKYLEIYETYYKKEWKKRYKGYDLPVKISSGNYNPGTQAYHTVPGTPIPRSDVAAGIANQLVGLANFQAKCKISQKNARPTEHLFLTYDFPGYENEETERKLRENSRHQYGRNRKEVEQAIEERLLVKRETNDDGEEPILREKSRAKTYASSKHKRPPKISPGNETP